jgi:hypothetical protein
MASASSCPRRWGKSSACEAVSCGRGAARNCRRHVASALANAGTPLYEIGTVLGHTQLSTTTRYAHHAPQRLVQTAATAERAWNLLPAPEPADHPAWPCLTRRARTKGGRGRRPSRPARCPVFPAATVRYPQAVR